MGSDCRQGTAVTNLMYEYTSMAVASGIQEGCSWIVQQCRNSLENS